MIGPFFPSDRNAGFAVIVHDSRGEVLDVNYGRIKPLSTLAVEAWSISVACAMGAARGIDNFVTELKCQGAVRSCLKGFERGLRSSNHP